MTFVVSRLYSIVDVIKTACTHSHDISLVSYKYHTQGRVGCATVCVVGLVVYVWRVPVCYALLPSGMSHALLQYLWLIGQASGIAQGGHMCRDCTTTHALTK